MNMRTIVRVFFRSSYNFLVNVVHKLWLVANVFFSLLLLESLVFT